MSAEVASVTRSWYPRVRTARGDAPNAQIAARRLLSVIALDYLTLSALATIIATERSDDGFTPLARSYGAGLTTARLSVSAVMPGRRMRARTVVSGTVIARRVRSTDASNSGREAQSSVKPPQCRRHGER